MSTSPFKERALETDGFQHDLFDINYKNLQQFLEKMVGVINAQAKSISAIEEQLETKALVTQVSECFLKMSNSINYNDSDLKKLVSNYEKQNPLPELNGNLIEDSGNKLSNRMNSNNFVLETIYKKTRDWEDRFLKLEASMSSKINKTELKEKGKKIQKKLNSIIDENRAKLSKRVDDVEKKVSSNLAQMEVQVKDVEKKTIWKIQDCEALLQKRTNNEYVDISCKNMEDRLRKEMAALSENNFSDVKKSITGLREKVDSLDNGTAEKIKTLKKSIMELEDNLNKTLLSEEKFEKFKAYQDLKSGEIERILNEVEKRPDPMSLFKRFMDSITKLEEKCNELEKSDDVIKYDLVELKLNMNQATEKKDNDKKSESSGYPVDPHKICNLETDQKKLKDLVHEYRDLIRKTDQNLKDKMDILESKLLNSLGDLKKDENKFAQLKDEILSSFDKSNSNLLEKIKSNIKEIEEINRKVVIIPELEKRVKKLAQKLDIEPLLKMIETKVNSSDLNRELLLLDEKIKTFQDLFNQMRKEFIKIDEFYNEFAAIFQTGQQEAITTFIGNNKITKSKCICCGNKGKNVNYTLYGNNHLQGCDGKVYRADLNNVSLYENTEVYDLSTNQIDNILNRSATLESKSIVNSQILPTPILKNNNVKERPTSAKTDIISNTQASSKKASVFLRPESSKK